MKNVILTIAALALLLCTPQRDARAYSYESVISEGCHEALCLEALRVTRQNSAVKALAAPVTSSRFAAEDQLLLRDLPFGFPNDMQDIETVALLIGVRDNDLKGRHGIDSQELSTVHGDPESQREHCLRRPEHDGPQGSVAALSECRDYIREQITHAIEHGLDENGRPDVDKRTHVDVHLAIGGRQRVALPIFYVYMGQALHTLQDSYTHTFRRAVTLPDGSARTEVTVVLNWVEFAEGRLDERRDGPAHMAALDQCDATDPLRVSRRSEATEASAALLTISLNPALSLTEKTKAIDETLNRYLSHEGCNAEESCSPTCNLNNRWCDAPENKFRPAPGCGCSIISPGGYGAFSLLAMLGLAFGIRRRRRQRERQSGTVVSLLIAPAVLYAPAIDAAEPVPAPQKSAPSPTAPIPTPASPPATKATRGSTPTAINAVIRAPLACVPGRQLSCACAAGSQGMQRCLPDGSGFGPCTNCKNMMPAAVRPPSSPSSVTTSRPPMPWQARTPRSLRAASPPLSAASNQRSPFGGYLAVGGAIDNLALAGSLGGRYRLSDAWLVGMDVEWNPWCSFESKRCRSGSVNFYATGIRRWDIGRDWVSLRSSLHLGGSVLTFDLLGASSGSVGPYLGASLLGVEFKLAEQWTLVLEPADVSLPAPHLTGAPLTYQQYRFTAGLQFGG